MLTACAVVYPSDWVVLAWVINPITQAVRLHKVTRLGQIVAAGPTATEVVATSGASDAVGDGNPV